MTLHWPRKLNFLFMDEKSDFGTRLCKALQAQGVPLRPSVLEREFNRRYWGRPVTLQAVRRWMRGEAIPAQDKLQVLAEWLKIDYGKHHVAASVPGGGSGGPSNPNPPPIAKKHDLATNEGMTAYVREREATAKRPPPPGTAPRTPQQ